MTPKLFGPRSLIRPRPASARHLALEPGVLAGLPESGGRDDCRPHPDVDALADDTRGPAAPGAMIRARSIGSGTSPTLG